MVISSVPLPPHPIHPPSGTGDVWDVRTTDVNEALCRRRYQVGGWGPLSRGT